MGQDEVSARQALLDMQERVARDPYEALGLTGSPDSAQIRAAFLQLTKRFHPAKFARMSTEVQKLANEVFLAIRAAHDTLQRPQVKTAQRSSPLSAPPRGLTPAGVRNATRTPTPPTGVPTSPLKPSPLAARPAAGMPRAPATPPFRDEGTQPFGSAIGRPAATPPAEPSGVRFATPSGRSTTGPVPRHYGDERTQPFGSTPGRPPSVPPRDEGSVRLSTPIGRPASGSPPPALPRDEGSVRLSTPIGRPATTAPQPQPPGAGDSQRMRPLGTSPTTQTPSTRPGVAAPGRPPGSQPRAAASGAMPPQGAGATSAITPPTSPPTTQKDPELAPILGLLEANHFAAARAALEVMAMQAPDVRRYQALIAYTKGREAQLNGDAGVARIELNEALILDPDLQLARTALNELFGRRK